jgi:hypothetical protein
MKTVSTKGWGSKGTKTLLAVWAVVFGLCLAAPAYSQSPKLIVKDAGGSNTVFSVDDTGAVGSGVTAPNYQFDLASPGGVMKSQMHFSLDGSDVGGWITSVLDNNFYLSSGATYDSTLGGWIQKSADGKSVFAGSGAAGYVVYLQSGASQNGVVGATPRFKIDYSGNVTVNGLAGSYSGGSAYVCVNNSGVLFTSESGCP